MRFNLLIIGFLIFPLSLFSYEKGRWEKVIEKGGYLKKYKPISKSIPQEQEEDPKTSIKVAPLGILSGWTTIMTEGFEGSFPPYGSLWEVFDNDGSTNGEYYWDDTNYKSYSGGWSAWCAKGGADGLNPAYNSYPNNCKSWMTYGPFSLADATSAKLSFYFWNKSESGYDKLYWMASIDDYNYYGGSISGDGGDTWHYQEFDLTNVPTLGNLCGKSQVWIAFAFESDSSITEKGAFLDDIVLQKYVASSGDAWDPTDNTPSGASLLIPTTTEQSHGPHTLSSSDQYDWYKIYMTSGITYNFNTRGGSGDNYGELYNGPGDSYTRVAYDDDSGGSSQFSFSYQAGSTQYYYLRVRAYSLGSSWSGYLKYSYTGGTPPSAPTNLTATPVSSSQINLSWTDNSNNETGFKLERKTGANGVYSQIATPAANATSYQDTGLSPNTTYYYRIRAYNSYGDSAYCPEANATTKDAWDPTDDTSNGATLLTPTTTNQSQGLHTLSPYDKYDWYKINMTQGLTYYFNTIGGSGDNYGELYNDLAGTNRVAYNDDSGGNYQFSFSYQASSSQPYYLRVRRYSQDSNSATWSGNLNYYYTGGIPPQAPTNLSANPVSSSQINLSWQNNANNETGFKLERSISSSPFVQIATLTANTTSFQDTNLTSNIIYTYQIRAYNNSGNSAYSNPVSSAPYAAGQVQGVILSVDGNSIPSTRPFRDEYLRIGATQFTTDSQGQYSASISGDINSSLQGPYVNAINDQGPSASYGPTRTTSWVWNYPVDLPVPNVNNNFDEVNVFYHVNNVHNWFRSLNVGNFTIMDFQMNTRVHYGNNWPNAGYDWQNNRLLFGHGDAHIGGDTRDTAKASEVIYHEYGHGIVFQLIGFFGGANDQTIALHEAYADYIAYTLTGDSQIGEWVFLNNANRRNLNNNLTRQNYNSNDPHFSSQIFSGGLFRMRNALGQSVADRLVIQSLGILSMVSGPSLPHFSERLHSIIWADQQLYGGVNASTIRNAFSAHNITDIPFAPTNLVATAISPTQINLSWTDNAYNEDAFIIYRKVSGDSYVQIGTVGANAISYPDRGLSSNTTYYYTVYAFNTYGFVPSNEAQGTTPGPPNPPSNLSATPVSSSQINLSWTDNSNNETGFKLERKTGANGVYSQIATPGANATSYQDTGLSPNTTYYYRIRAYNSYGDSNYSNEANATTQGGAQVIYLDNFDDGNISDWERQAGTNLWHIEGNSNHSPPYSVAYNNGINYNTGQTNSGWITSPNINLQGKTGNITLNLWTKWQHESYPYGDYDNMKIEVTNNNGATWNRIFYNDCNEGPSQTNWHEETFNISSIASDKIIRIRFSFNTIDRLYNNFFGWYIDDVKIVYNPSLSFSKFSEVEHIDEPSPPRQLAPKETKILQSFPNPANDKAYFPFELSEDSEVRITIYNILGQKIKELNLGEKSAGYYNTSSGITQAPLWEVKDISSGLYFYKVEIKTKSGKEYTTIKNMVINRR
ncbi:MAG: fibronectin type III domain-containing protein [bacterium]